MRTLKQTLRDGVPAAVIAMLLCTPSHAARATAQIIVEKTGADQVTVRYRLLEPVTELIFTVDAPVIRSGYWKVDGAVVLRSDRIVSDVPFTEASAVLRPNDRFIDRVYPSLFTIDSSTAVVNLDFIRLDEPLADVAAVIRNAYDPDEQTCVRRYEIQPAVSAAYTETAGRFVMLSDSLEDCRAQVNRSEGRVFLSPGVSPVIADTVSRNVAPVYDALQEQFGFAPGAEPTVFLSQEPSDGNSYQGEVGWHSMISLRLYGSAWNTPDRDDATQILSFLTHELVHTWIGKFLRVESADGKGEPWLHEGAAEYVALLTLARQNLVSHEVFAEQVASRFTACGQALDAGPLLSERGPRRGSVVYDCGLLVQFVYDVVGRSASGDGGSVIELWRDLLDGAREDGTGAIDAARFIDSNPQAASVLSGLLHGPEVDMNAIAAALMHYGVDSVVRKNTDARTIAAHLVFPILHADCESGSIGFWTNADHLVLDANETCASVPAGFVLRQVAGVDLLEQPSAAYDAAARACADGGSLQLAGRTPEEPELRVRCPAPLPPHPVDVDIRVIDFLRAAP